jgi:hypothetical protein
MCSPHLVNLGVGRRNGERHFEAQEPPHRPPTVVEPDLTAINKIDKAEGRGPRVNRGMVDAVGLAPMTHEDFSAYSYSSLVEYCFEA